MSNVPRLFTRKLKPVKTGGNIRRESPSGGSSLAIVTGNYATHFEVKDFCVNAVTLLRSLKIPVIWALKTVEPSVVEAPSAIDLLKDLTSQALRLNIALHNERSLVLSCTKFLGAESENDWFDILAAVLAGLPQIYICD